MRYNYTISGLKLAYRTYLQVTNPKLSAQYINTQVSDAFWFLNIWSTEAFLKLACCVDYNHDLLAHDLADQYLAHRQNPLRDAKAYCRALDRLQGFMQILLAVENARKREPRQVQLSLFD